MTQSVAARGGVARKYHLAMAYVQVGNLERGQEILDAALKIDPNVPEVAMARQTFADAVRPATTRKSKSNQWIRSSRGHWQVVISR